MRHRISLLTLLGAVAVVGAALGLVGRHLNSQRARQNLRTLGVLVDVRTFQDQRDTRREASYKVGGTGDIFAIKKPYGEDLSAAQFEQLLRSAGSVSDLAGISIVDSPPTIDIFRFTGFRGIRLLEISGPPQIEGLEHLPKFQRLQQLVLAYNSSFGDAHMPLIAQCRGLRSLDISGTAVSDDGLETVLLKRALRELRLRDTDLSAKSFLQFGECQDLQILDVSGSPKFSPLSNRSVRDRRIHDLIFGYGYKEFRAYPLHNKDAALAPVHVPAARFPAKLRWLDVLGWEFSTSATEALTRLPDLEYINLAGQTLDDKEVEMLSRCAALRRVGLANTNLNDDALLRLVTAESYLEALDLRGTAVTKTGIEKLRVKPGRLYLLVGEGTGRFSTADLEAIMRCCSNKELYLESDGTITEESAEALTERYPLVKCQIRKSF